MPIIKANATTEARMMRSNKVVILYRYIPQYRLEFYKRLYKLCENKGIDLHVIYGDPSKSEKTKGDSVSFDRGNFVKNRYFSFGHTELIWQPVLGLTRSADLVIVEQANKLLINFPLVLRQLCGNQRICFVGHGRNFQATKRHRLSELLKKSLIRTPHWWFAYTSRVANLVEAAGFPADRVTIYNNAIDTYALSALRREITEDELRGFAAQIGVTSKNVCLFVGGIYSEKRISFLLDVCERLRTRIPDFQMIVVGGGPDDFLVRNFNQKHPWLIFTGPLVGREKVKCFMLSKLMLMPGLVGLAVLDTFALEVPLITTNVPYHSPEIDYLESGTNGIIVSPFDDADCYAAKVAEFLLDEQKRLKLVAGCRSSAPIYTIEKMADLFCDGIVQALATQR
jgi:glycosyltransferase involved in cell wall biosynthesis